MESFEILKVDFRLQHKPIRNAATVKIDTKAQQHAEEGDESQDIRGTTIRRRNLVYEL